MSEIKSNIFLWKKRWGMQILLCVFLGVLHIFVGYEAEDVTKYMAAIYGIPVDGFDEIRTTLWMLPILSACTFSGMYMDMEMGPRRYFVLSRYESYSKYKHTLLKERIIGAMGLIGINVIILVPLGILAAAYYGKVQYLEPKQVLVAVTVYSVHLLFLILLMTELQLITENTKLSQVLVVIFLITVFLIPSLPQYSVYFHIGAWGSLSYSSMLWEKGFWVMPILIIELVVCCFIFGKGRGK
ncbi:MAG: hypothetical protein II992_07775 [Lachnospiraceae bacterium]|nr:hypothetical protein [Lachnospiraceae bacterium]